MNDDVKKFVDDIWKKEFDEFIANDAVNRHIKTLQQELDQYKNNWEELKEYILNHYIVGHEIQNASLDNILNKMKELEEDNNGD